MSKRTLNPFNPQSGFIGGAVAAILSVWIPLFLGYIKLACLGFVICIGIGIVFLVKGTKS